MNEMIDTFANRLNKAINIRNIKPVELAEKTGIDKSKISSYMSGRYKAKQDGIYLLANALDVSEAWLMGLDVPMDKNVHIKQKPKAIKVPVLGYVRAGIPLEAIEEILDYEEIPAEWANDNSEYFGLTVKGDSMFPYIIETDVIIFKKTNNSEALKGKAKSAIEDKKMAKQLTDAMIERIIELNPDITEKELNKLIRDKILVMKTKKLISLKPIEDRFKERIEKYMIQAKEMRLK